MAMVGANPKVLRDAAADLRRRAAAVDHARATVNGKLYAVDWRGPAANRFRSRWRNELSPRLSRTRDELYGMATQLMRQADQQERASAGCGPQVRRVTPMPLTDPNTGWTVVDGEGGMELLAGIAGIVGKGLKIHKALNHLRDMMKVKDILTSATFNKIRMLTKFPWISTVLSAANLGLTIHRHGFDSPKTWYEYADFGVTVGVSLLALTVLTGPAAPLVVVGWAATSALLKVTNLDVKIGDGLRTAGHAVGRAVGTAASSAVQASKKVGSWFKDKLSSAPSYDLGRPLRNGSSWMATKAKGVTSGVVSGARNLWSGGWNRAASAFGS